MTANRKLISWIVAAALCHTAGLQAAAADGELWVIAPANAGD